MFLVCYARGMAAIPIHVLLRLPFYLWLKLFHSHESAVVYLPRLLCRKGLATVISIRCESAAPRRWWTVTFFRIQFRGLASGSSGVFHPFKGCSNGLHLLEMKLPFGSWTLLWFLCGLSLLFFTHSRLLLMTLGPYSRLTFLEVTQRPLGPSWVALSWAFSHHVTCLPLGLRQMVLMGSFLICHSFGKKWAST